MKFFIVTLLALLMATVAGAAEGPKTGFWDSLKEKAEKITPRKKPAANTAVGGVRSAKQQETELYWKGKEKPLEADEEELDVFKQALKQAAAGKRDESIKSFEAFLSKYPQSQLKKDTHRALDQLKLEK
ncbi:MAG TPA: hypothetical protein VGJ93_03600 [Desulfuromonadaceae bacterium]